MQSAYGIPLLDDLHDVFPEILYDTEMFVNNALVEFIRTRMRTTFPSEFVRHQTRFRIQNRPPRVRTAAATISAPPTIPTVRVSSPHPRTPPLTSTRFTVPLTNGFQSIASLFDMDGISAGLGAGLGAGLTEILRTAIHTEIPPADLTPVPVRPSSEDIRHATIVTTIEPAADVVCAVCQDHQPPQNSSNEWRIIRHCNHRFHKSCIDRWFNSGHVNCPTCRFDIRDYSTPTEETMD
jgi:hypothetical protein